MINNKTKSFMQRVIGALRNLLMDPFCSTYQQYFPVPLAEYSGFLRIS